MVKPLSEWTDEEIRARLSPCPSDSVGDEALREVLRLRGEVARLDTRLEACVEREAARDRSEP